MPETDSELLENRDVTSPVIRAYIYLILSGLIWFGEGAVFANQLKLQAWQVALLATLYALLYFVVVRVFQKGMTDSPASGDAPSWRLLAVAPMLAMMVGSFVSLPLILLVVALGKLF